MKNSTNYLSKKRQIASVIYDEIDNRCEMNAFFYDLFGLKKKNNQHIVFDNLLQLIKKEEKSWQQLKQGKPIRLILPYNFDKIKELNLYNTTQKGSILLQIDITSYIDLADSQTNQTIFILKELPPKKEEIKREQNNRVLEKRLDISTTQIDNAKEISELIFNSTIHILLYDIQSYQFFNLKGKSPFKDGSMLNNLIEIAPEKECNKIIKTVHSITIGALESITETICFFDPIVQNHLLHYHCKFDSKRNIYGKLEFIYCTLIDITSSIEPQKRIEAINNKQQLLLYANKLTQWNYSPLTHDISIYKKDGTSLLLKGKIQQYLPMVHPADQTLVEEYVTQMNQLKKQLDTIQVRLKYHEKEKYRHIEINTIPVKKANKVSSYIGLLKDATSYIEQKDELKKSNKQLKLMLAVGKSIGITWHIQEDTFTTLLPSLKKTNEDSSCITENLTLQQLLSNVHPTYKSAVEKSLNSIKKGTSETLQIELKYDPNGIYEKYKELHLTVIENINGQPSLAIGFCQDITEKVVNRKKIEKQNKYIFTLLDSIPTPILLIEDNDKAEINYANKSSIQLEKKIEKKSLANIFETTLSSDKANLTTQEKISTSTNQVIKRVKTKQGGYLDLILHKYYLEDEEKKFILGTIYDITKIKQLQERNNQLINSIALMEAYTWMYDSRKKQIFCDNTLKKLKFNSDSLNNIERFYDCMHPDDRVNYINTLKLCIKNQEQDKFYFVFRFDPTHSNKFEWWENKAIIERKEENNTKYFQLWGLCYNINKIKQNELKLKKTECELTLLNKKNSLILDNAQAGLIFVDNHQTIKWENLSHTMPSLSFSKKIKKGEQLYTDFLTSIDIPFKESTFYRSLLSGKTEKGEHTTPEGIILEASTSLVLGENNKRMGSVIRLIDVTEKCILLKKVQAGKEEAERLNNLKSNFLANVSHEIRTPLNAIYGFSQLFEEELSQQEKSEYLKIIKANNELLLNLINSVLDLSKIESGVLTLKEERLDFALLFNKIAQSMQQNNKNEAVKLTVENPYNNFLVTADKDKITQVIINYVSNAIKYTPKGNILMGYKQKDNGLFIYVKDTGIGIPHNKQNRVFERFEKLDCFAQGTGLGLSICKAIALSYKGKVGFTSEEGTGSTFWAWIPLLETKEHIFSK